MAKPYDPSELTKHVNPKHLDLVLNCFSLLWRTGNWNKARGKKFPDLTDIAPNLPQLTPVAIQDVLLSGEFARGANLRGIPYYFSKDQQKGLTSQQMLAAGIILDFSNGATLAQRLKRAGISSATYHNWMKFPPFRQMIDVGADEMLRDSYVDMQRGLVQTAVKGDVNAIKFAYELMGKYDPNAKTVMDVQAVMSRMIEVLQKHIKDPNILGAIAYDLNLLATQALPPVAGVVTGEVISLGDY